MCIIYNLAKSFIRIIPMINSLIISRLMAYSETLNIARLKCTYLYVYINKFCYYGYIDGQLAAIIAIGSLWCQTTIASHAVPDYHCQPCSTNNTSPLIIYVVSYECPSPLITATCM